MKRMLFNATHSEELRVAIVDGQTLVDLDIEFIDSESKRGNIYKGIVTKVEPSLEAVFVDYGAQRQGFLSLKDISRNCFPPDFDASTPMSQVKVQDVVSAGDAMIVQVERNERGNKGAALTTFISLAGRFLVLLPNNPRGGGISRQIEGVERYALKEILAQLDVPEKHAVIGRTAGIGQNIEHFRSDLDYLVNLWKSIENAASENDGPFLIYQESSLVPRTLRDYMREDIDQILVDDEPLYDNIKQFVGEVMPTTNVRIQHYQDAVPLFSRFQIEHQIKDAFERSVKLPTGGVIVIEQTEALVTIDVNSARSTKGADIEETALETNLEAVEQVAKHLRVRDIGGLIVIDLIDMSSPRNRRAVEKRLLESVESDRARTRIGRISQFGLLEMSRQRLRSSIEESSYDECSRCKGRGYIRSVTSTALSILRIIEEDALKENTELIHAHLPVDVATFLINEKRHELALIERRMGTRIVVVPSRNMYTPDHHIFRFTSAELEEQGTQVSYTLKVPDAAPEVYNFIRAGEPAEPPVIAQAQSYTSPEPQPEEKNISLLSRVAKTIFRTSSSEPEPAAIEVEETPPKSEPVKKRRQSKPRSTRSGQRSQRPSDRKSPPRKETSKPARKKSPTRKPVKSKNDGSAAVQNGNTKGTSSERGNQKPGGQRRRGGSGNSSRNTKPRSRRPKKEISGNVAGE